jgi:hypothetical protein
MSITPTIPMSEVNRSDTYNSSGESAYDTDPDFGIGSEDNSSPVSIPTTSSQEIEPTAITPITPITPMTPVATVPIESAEADVVEFHTHLTTVTTMMRDIIVPQLNKFMEMRANLLRLDLDIDKLFDQAITEFEDGVYNSMTPTTYTPSEDEYGMHKERTELQKVIHDHAESLATSLDTLFDHIDRLKSLMDTSDVGGKEVFDNVLSEQLLLHTNYWDVYEYVDNYEPHTDAEDDATINEQYDAKYAKYVNDLKVQNERIKSTRQKDEREQRATARTTGKCERDAQSDLWSSAMDAKARDFVSEIDTRNTRPRRDEQFSFVRELCASNRGKYGQIQDMEIRDANCELGDDDELDFGIDHHTASCTCTWCQHEKDRRIRFKSWSVQPGRAKFLAVALERQKRITPGLKCLTPDMEYDLYEENSNAFMYGSRDVNMQGDGGDLQSDFVGERPKLIELRDKNMKRERRKVREDQNRQRNTRHQRVLGNDFVHSNLDLHTPIQPIGVPQGGRNTAYRERVSPHNSTNRSSRLDGGSQTSPTPTTPTHDTTPRVIIGKVHHLQDPPPKPGGVSKRHPVPQERHVPRERVIISLPSIDDEWSEVTDRVRKAESRISKIALDIEKTQTAIEHADDDKVKNHLQQKLVKIQQSKNEWDNHLHRLLDTKHVTTMSDCTEI